MRRILTVALGLLLAAPAAADMFQNAGNADQPQALQNLTNQILTISGGVLQAGSGTETPIYGTSTPTVLDIVKGTDAAPVTVAGQQIRILYRQAVTRDKCGGNPADVGCVSPILVNAIGGAATTVVTSGITTYAQNASTVTASNVQAINGIGDVVGDGTVVGTGAYFVGRDRTNSGTGRSLGAEISAANYSGANTCAVATTGLSRCVGLWLAARSTSASTPLDSALQIGTGDPTTEYGRWKQGITLNDNAFGTGIVGTVSFGDYSGSETSLHIRGTHKYAMRTDPIAAGIVGLGAMAPTAKLEMDGNYAGPYASDGVIFAVKPFAFTDTTSSGVVGTFNASRIAPPVLRATNPTTYSIASTLTVGGCPTADTNVTITECYALKSGGDSLVQGVLSADAIKLTSGAAVLNADSVVAPRMIYVGDSLTFSGYDKYIALSNYRGKAFSTDNIGIGSTSLAGGATVSWLTNAPDWLDPLYQNQSPVNIALIWLGTNDTALLSATPATVWANLQTMALAEQRRGFKVCVGTMISRGAPAPGTWDTNLTTLNGLITAGWAGAGVNCLVNFGANANLSPNGSNFNNTTYYSTDKTHLNAAGQQLAASIAQAALNTYIGTLPATPSASEFNAPGNMTAAGLATAGTIAGSLCRTSTGTFIYKAGANCF